MISIEADVPQITFDFTSGGLYGPVGQKITTKEQADQSLPYPLAVALLDGTVMPAQFAPDRINRADVQQLLGKVVMRPDQDYTREYPSQMPAKITVRLKDGMVRTRTVQGFPGLPSHPFTRQDAMEKFDQLVDGRLDHSLSDEIKHAVQSLETILYRTFLVRSAWISGPNCGDPGRGSGPLPRGQRVQTDWVTDGQAVDRAAELAPEPVVAGRNPRHPAAHRGGLFGLVLGALGIVFGDIGTSPLYAVQTVFSIDNHAVGPTPGDVYGVVSLIFWSVTLIVTVKYVSFILRADNDGEGGVMALAALVRGVSGSSARLASIALALGVLGASLFYGDSLITPAISVLSAVEGLEVARPELGQAVLPIGIVILTLLFVVQRWGTHQVGRLFGPVMVLWFGTLAVLGVPHIAARPSVLLGLSPTYAVSFFAVHPLTAFLAMGAVVLAITGAEALYADVGHFGRRPIRVAWFVLAFPALTLNYLGQAALILTDPHAVDNPFYRLAPGWAQLPLVVLATCATVIASQAVISGAFSVSRQAVRLGYLPPLTVRHTSTQESGQIYVPAVNWLLFGGVLVLMVVFGSSARLATAYGLAVTGTLLLTTTLFLIYAMTAWHWARWKLVLVAIVFGGIELTFLAANLTKIVHGGWLPLLVAGVVATVMTTWQRGRRIVTARRVEVEGPLPDFVEKLNADGIPRVPGTAVFPHPTKETAPLALRANVEFNYVLHERVVIVSVQSENVPHVPPGDRVTIDQLGHPADGIVHLLARLGFQDDQHIPDLLRESRGLCEELEFDADTVSYFLSHIIIERGPQPGMSTWRKRLFIALAHNAATPATYFKLPPDRTVVMGSRIEL